MQNFETFFKNLLKDLKTELSDEFDRNFERKAFFDKRWPETKLPNNKGSLMMRSGIGRRSIKSHISGHSIVWTSFLEYMALHNEGGTVTVTAKMKRFFWAMYYKTSNALTYSVKTRQANNTKRNRRLTEEAANWKALALQKVGAKMVFKERRFIGPHPHVDIIVKNVVDYHVDQLEKDLYNTLKNRK